MTHSRAVTVKVNKNCSNRKLLKTPVNCASVISPIPLLADSTFAIDEIRQRSKYFRLTDSPIGDTSSQALPVMFSKLTIQLNQ